MIISWWWESTSGDKNIHWISKIKLFKPKTFGGLGFKDPMALNKAMLARPIGA